MGSRARNVLLGMAGGVQGFQQAAQLERQEEEQKLKKKLVELQMQTLQDKLIDSGLKREQQTKLRLALRQKVASGQPVQFEDIAEFADVDDTMKFLVEMSKEKQKAATEATKLQGFAPGSLVTQGGQPLFQVPDRSKILSPEEEEQKIRIGQATQRSRLLSPEEEAQQTRIAGAKAAAVQAEKPLESGVQKELVATEKILDSARMALINFDEKFVGPGAARQGAARESFGETPIIGRLVGGPLSEKETTFRQSFSALKNAIRNKDFGAALTEFEAAEANKALSDLEKSPISVRTALRRLGVLFQKALERQRMLAITPRSQLRQGNVPNIQPPQGFVEE